MARTRLLPTLNRLTRTSSQRSRITSPILCAATCRIASTDTLATASRAFTTSSYRSITSTPKRQAAPPSPATPVDLSDERYHQLADEWLENALTKFEDLQDEGQDIDVEFSSGVMTIRTEEKGTYVLNKQPPNKQIWLSSPLSGPKRYDWTVIGDGQGEKEGTGAGRWVYTRDQTTLDALILEELGVDLETPTQA